jgi:hypoxanthine phosphoribosyltransferase
MTPVTLNDKTFDIYLSEQTIQDRIRELAAQINQDYAGKTGKAAPLFIGILNGAFMFASDLFKQLTIEAEISFIKLASYSGTKSTGKVVTAIGLDQDLIGRDIIIIEDIVDTGKTLYEFLPKLQHHQPASLRIATLLHKPEATQFDLKLDYVGFAIPNKFVVGYGLDYDGIGRNLKEIYQLSGKE